MGRDKATLRWSGDPSGHTFAQRSAALLNLVCPTAVEVGPGHSSLLRAQEEPPGQGPLSAVAAGWRTLVEGGFAGPVLVIATDLPRLSQGLLEWLADYPTPRSVVPVVDGRVQPLCARFQPADLDLARRLVAGGRRSMNALLDACDPVLVDEGEWLAPAGDASALSDVDTPGDMQRLGPR